MTKKHNHGIFISFEGGEGGGKTVQSKLLSDYFRKQGREVIITREPGGTVISEQIREVVLSAKNIGMAFTTEVLLFQAARAQVYRELIIPSLKAGKVVICDRTSDSSIVYQGIVRGFGEEMIRKLNDISTQKTYPDLTILLDLPVTVGLKRRVISGKMDRIDMEQTDFHKKVRQGYLDLAKKNAGDRWVIVNANRSINVIHKDIIDNLQKKINKFR